MANHGPSEHARSLAPPTLPTKVSVAVGELASNPTWNIIAGYLLFYYYRFRASATAMPA